MFTTTVEVETSRGMNHSSVHSSFFDKLSKKIVSKQKNYFFVVLVFGLVLLIVYIKIQCELKNETLINFETNKFDWLKDKNFLPLYLKPEEDTAILVPRNISAFVERKFIACFVISSPKNVKARNAVRQTWGQLIKPIFLVGRSDKKTLVSVAHEARTFDDIIIEDFIDSYVNLTIKTAFAMKNFLNFFKDSTYFFKIDDDVFLNVKSFYEMLENVPRDVLIGKVEYNSRVVRNKLNKWFIPKFLFKDECFPNYVHGPAYLIPGLARFPQLTFKIIKLNLNLLKTFQKLFNGKKKLKSLI